MVSKPSAGGKPSRPPNPDDYAGILSKEETRKRIKRRKKDEAKTAEPKRNKGRPKGSFSLRTQMRKTGERLRGNRPLFVLMVEALYDAAISGDRNFNSAPGKLILEHLEGKPMQTIVTNPENRDGYADKTDEELLRIIGRYPFTRAARAAPKERKGEDAES